MGALWAARSKLDADQGHQLTTLWQKANKSKIDKCEIDIRYHLSNATPGKLNYGRYYGTKGSFEKLENYVRGTLAHKYYTDIDIVNCHPTLIVQYAKRYFDMEMPHLNHYVENRSQFFQSMNEFGMQPEDVKQLMMSVMYFGRLEDSDTNTEIKESFPDTFRKMQAECKDLVSRIINSLNHQALYDYCRKYKSNTKGSFLAFVIQTEERRCLETLFDYFTGIGLQIDVLAYDGLMARTTTVDESLLRQAEQRVSERTGYHIRLAKKDFKIFSDIHPTTPTEKNKQYLQMKALFERNHFYFQPTDTFVEITESGDHQHYTCLHASNVFNTKAWQLNDPYDPEKPVPFFDKWRRDPERRIVTHVVAKMPSECLPTEISLFHGYRFQYLGDYSEEETAGAVDTFNDLVRCIAGDTEELFQYLLKSLARMIQNPLKKSNACVIISSEAQGSGKDTLMLWMSRIMGHHVAHYSSDETFWNKHDTQKEGAVLMYLEEAGVGENKRNSDALKARITEDIVYINPKGMKCYGVQNIGNYFMTTNNVCPVKLEISDRRFIILNPSMRFLERGKSDKMFWSRLYTKLDTDAWLWAVGRYLESLDITGFLPTDFPETEIRSLLMDAVQQETPEETFLKQWDGVDQTATQMFNAYTEFCTAHSLRYKPSVVSFTIAIAKLRRYYTKRETKKANVYSSTCLELTGSTPLA